MGYRIRGLHFESDVGNVVKFSYQNVKHITLICQHDKLPLVIIIIIIFFFFFFFFFGGGGKWAP